MPVGALDIKYSYAQAQLKGEDVIVVPQNKKTTSYYKNFVVFAVCDGHGGQLASVYVGRRIEEVIYENINTDELEAALQNGISEVAEVLRDSLHSAFLQLDRDFTEEYNVSDGTTATVIIVYGRLLTVANVGDSKALYVVPESDAGEELTDDHRIEDNESERLRMTKEGATVSQTRIGNKYLGVMRIQPSGLALSRSIGDIQSKPYVVANPHITQVLLPVDQKSKIVLASDGLWDDLTIEEVAMYTSRKKLTLLPSKLIKKATQSNGGQLGDDISVVAISLKPCKQKQLDVAREAISRKLLGIKEGTQNPLTTKSKFVGSYDLDKCPQSYVDNPFLQQNHYQNGFQDLGWRFPMPILCVDTLDASNKLDIQNTLLTRKSSSKNSNAESQASKGLSSSSSGTSLSEYEVIQDIIVDESGVEDEEGGEEDEPISISAPNASFSKARLNLNSNSQFCQDLTISPVKVVRKRVHNVGA